SLRSSSYCLITTCCICLFCSHLLYNFIPNTTLLRSPTTQPARTPGQKRCGRKSRQARTGHPTPATAAHQTAYAPQASAPPEPPRSEEHTSELQSRFVLLCCLLLEKKKLPRT